MNEHRGERSAIIGKSTHNQRIERLWRDVFEGCLHHFYQLFHYLEDDGKLDPLQEVHLFALQYVYTSRINQSLEEWSSAWAGHRLRTAGKTPSQLWYDGQVENPVGIPEHELDLHHSGSDDEEYDNEISQVTCVQEPRNPLVEDARQQLSEEIDPMRSSSELSVDVYLDVVQFIMNYLS
ncbi:uncharacterized protein LOC117100130 [Anneissia japonica]|uniref:uncharacterized protein LOC117100130 n=1 Tax=Anneissia japonica TaxID=1529436 RepID=UPI001425516A|nr:uncharacterized protein LOC117100130 [Anneissia japonica]